MRAYIDTCNELAP